MGILYIVPRTGKFTRNIKGLSRILGHNRYYGLLPLMIALTCTLKFGLKWSYHIQNIFANPFEFYGIFCVIKPQFCWCAQKRFGACRYHTGVFTEFCKVGHEKKWAGKWDCYPSQKLSSFHSRKNCECFYCTPITIPTMCNDIVDNVCYM